MRSTGRSLKLGLLIGVCIAALSASIGCRDSQERNDAAMTAGIDEATLKKRVDRLRKENDKLLTRLDKLVPKDPYIVVSTTENRIYLRKGEETLMEAVCSTGSNTGLTDPGTKKSWFFSTPHGVFKVKNRRTDPVWKMPTWGMIEAKLAGEEILPEDLYQEGVLGKYALDLGDGYMIHGTLFQRFLGLNVTHGCIRVGDDDLEKIWERTKIGTQVYIF